MPDLLERLKSAEGPNFALDWELHCMSGMEGVGLYGKHPAYTASLDAALALMQKTLGPKWRVQHLGQNLKGWCCRIETDGLSIPQTMRLIQGPNAPLAILIALVTAVETQSSI